MVSNVAENIRRLAGMFLVEQRQLAAAAGVTRQSMYAIYSGRSRPKTETALAIAQAFGITVEDLYSTPRECLTAAIPHLDDAPITTALKVEEGKLVDIASGEVIRPKPKA